MVDTLEMGWSKAAAQEYKLLWRAEKWTERKREREREREKWTERERDKTTNLIRRATLFVPFLAQSKNK